MKAIHNCRGDCGKGSYVVVYTKGTEYESNSQPLAVACLAHTVVVYTKGTEYESNSQQFIGTLEDDMSCCLYQRY